MEHIGHEEELVESEGEHMESEGEHMESEEEDLGFEEEHMEHDEEPRLYREKMGDDLLRSVWLYFGMPSKFIQAIRVLNDKPYDEKFIFFVAKAVVTDILENRNAHGVLFKKIYDRCSTSNTDVLRELDAVIGSQIETKKDLFSAFITLCAILADFIVYLRCQVNFFTLDRERVLLYWVECYEGYFQDQMKDLGVLNALLNTARKKAGSYPFHILKRFTHKYCNPNAAYNEKNIPLLFKAEIQTKQFSKPISLFK